MRVRHDREQIRAGSTFQDLGSTKVSTGVSPGHQNKGPFRRTDDRIKQQVNQLLADHHEIDASKITIEVTDGRVTLTGTVSDREHRRMIEDLVLAMADLEGVRVSIELKADTASPLSDAAHQLPAPIEVGGVREGVRRASGHCSRVPRDGPPRHERAQGRREGGFFSTNGRSCRARRRRRRSTVRRCGTGARSGPALRP